MLSITKELKKNIQKYDSIEERLSLLKDKYVGETAYLISCGPSLNDVDIDVLKSKLKDKLVVCQKQSIDILGADLCDFHIMNTYNVKPTLYDYGKNITADRRYYYEMELQINGDDAPAFVIFNFTTPSDVDAMINQTKKYVMPHFSKNMKSSGMVGWGLGTKITPQGEEFSSVMTYDSYDSLENVMLHLAGKGIIEGLPFDKLTPVDWTMRPIMSVLSVTDPRE